jgi:hypothetical protein
MCENMHTQEREAMKITRILDPRNWIPGPELADGMLGYGLEDFLPRKPWLERDDRKK